MGEPSFWDDQERAAKVSSEHARASRKLAVFRELEHDVDDLEQLAELSEEDPQLSGELEEQLSAVRRRLEALEEERLFGGPYDPGDALVTVNAGAGTKFILPAASVTVIRGSVAAGKPGAK